MKDRSKIGQPGWTGNAVVIRAISRGKIKTLAVVRLDPRNGVVCDNPKYLEEWTKEGIMGRPDPGRVYPKDGQKFLDELPFVYNGTYCSAEPYEPEP